MKFSTRRPKLFRASPASMAVLALLLLPVAAYAQAAGSPFDTGFKALQNLCTGTIAKVASLIAIVVGGYGFAHGEPGAKKQLGVANRDLAVIQSITPDGRIAARLEGGRQIEFNAAEHRHFDHGYAVTSHSAQGLTSERVLIHADTGVHPELLNSRFGYVSVSRATYEAVIFTNDASRLNQHVGVEITKTSVLQISEPSD